MTKRALGVLAALTMVAGSVACSSSSSNTGTPATDAGGNKDAVVTPDGGGPKDTGKPPGEVSVVDGTVPSDADKTTGKVCTTDDDCDVSGNGINFCSNAGFTSGTLNPSPVCVGRECDPGDGTTIQSCDADTGVCLSTGSGGICFGFCEFSDDGAAPKGCAGKNTCNVYGWGTDMTTKKPTGIGYCFGGCKTDADCTKGDKCQVEDGLCFKTLSAYTFKPGDACTKADAEAKPPKCNCLYTTSAGKGYCANVCKIGDTCGAGFTCDSGLPIKDAKTGDPLFAKAPVGIGGYCLKNCAADGDCPANSYCEATAGNTQKTCQIGTRP